MSTDPVRPAAPATFLSLPPEAAEARVVELGGRPFHARVIRREVLERGVLEYEAMTALAKPLRASLERELPLLGGREVARSRASDGTTKLLLAFPPRGRDVTEARVETVHIPSRRAGVGATVCVSTQVGCPVGCPFCASGLLGLERNLAAHEILEQFLRARAIGPLSRGVVMGIGEPLLNLEALVAALAVVHGELGLGARRLTVSTIGFPERVARLAERRPPFQLAISLHSADDAQRAELVPPMKDVPVEEVLSAGDRWFAATGREVTYEVVLLGGTNDTAAHAALLARRLAGRRATVNLIPYNPVPALPYRRPAPEAVEAFRRRLAEAGLVATVRWSRGLEADAACGQLRARGSAPAGAGGPP